VSDEQQPVDLDFGPVEDLSGEGLVEQYRRLVGILYDGQRPRSNDVHESVSQRARTLWPEIKSRADTEEPPCPECSARDWGQVPGDPIVCGECGYEGRRNDEQAVFDAWDAMSEEVGSGR
jgi:hypothetical protein